MEPGVARCRAAVVPAVMTLSFGLVVATLLSCQAPQEPPPEPLWPTPPPLATAPWGAEATIARPDPTQVAYLTAYPELMRASLTPRNTYRPPPAVTPTPGPTAFRPWPRRTPAGAGAIITGSLLYSFDVYFAMMSRFSYHHENAWYTDSEGGRVRTVAYAGAVKEPGGRTTMQGEVLVRVIRVAPQQLFNYEVVQSDVVLTPVQVGAVRIVDAVGERLILQAKDGTTFYFDVPARRFVSSLTEAVPSATLKPTRTATPTATLTFTPCPPRTRPPAGTPYLLCGG